MSTREVCWKRGCKKRGQVRDDDTFITYCWEHRQGVKHQECGCEYDLVTSITVVWCVEHWKMFAHIQRMATGRRPTRLSKKKAFARAKRIASSKKWRSNAQFVQKAS